MKKELTDKDIDRLFETLIAHSAPPESLLDEIANSPAGWWGVQRKIAVGKENAKSPWPPVAKWWSWLGIGAATFAAIGLIFAFIGSEPAVQDPTLHASATFPGVSETRQSESGPTQTHSKTEPIPSTVVSKPDGMAKRDTAKRTFVSQRRSQVARILPNAAKEVIASEYIALTYGGNPDSGHIVRVKVPSSMMVSLGVVPSVEKPSSLVDAEVVVGDDGQNHAIRFIRQ